MWLDEDEDMSLYHEIVEALVPLVSVFEQYSIVYYIGGSVSSSVHGIARRTQDVDVVANILPHEVPVLVKALQQDYYVDEAAWIDAVRQRFSYNLIYLQTMTKIDVMPLRQRAFTQEEERRAQPHVLEAGAPPIRIVSAEDAVLTKLEWFQQGGQSSARQWNDILGIIRRRGKTLDMSYLQNWAITLGVHDLLERALLDAGSVQS
jgi:hypothetical protein